MLGWAGPTWLAADWSPHSGRELLQLDLRLRLQVRAQAYTLATSDGFVLIVGDCLSFPDAASKARQDHLPRPQQGAMTRINMTECTTSHASTVLNICALTDLDDVAVGVADVAADLAVLGLRRGEELGSTTLP
jgi:hypothetical protein